MLKDKPSEKRPHAAARGMSFAEKVRAIVRRIPRGKTMSYGEVARRAGSPRAARAVGAILHRNRDPNIPCHRIIRADGKLGGYNRGAKMKAQLLYAESAYGKRRGQGVL